MQLRYHPAADRLLWQLRTTNGDLYAVWLTRRMVRLLWPPMAKLVTNAGLAQAMPHATVVPEAQAMLAQAMRERPLPGASFDQPFDTRVAARPLGPEPLLPEAIDLGPGDNGQGLKLQLREGARDVPPDPVPGVAAGTSPPPSGRRLAMHLSADLATALQRLMEQALAAADWGLVVAPAQPSEDSGRPGVLN